MSKKVKYRIRVSDRADSNYPYHLERKVGFFSFWMCVDVHASVQQAEDSIAIAHAKYMKSALPKLGTVVKVYKPVDLTALMLKGSNAHE